MSCAEESPHKSNLSSRLLAPDARFEHEAEGRRYFDRRDERWCPLEGERRTSVLAGLLAVRLQG